MATAYIIANNPKYNSREIKFESKPNAETREALKALKMRWNPSKAVWYGFASEDAIVDALSLTNVDQPENLPKPAQPLKPYKPSKTTKPEAVNAEGVKVGDLFVSCWGYEQTNREFFQVVALKGQHTIILKQIRSEIVDAYGMGGTCRACPDDFYPGQPEDGYTVRTHIGQWGLSIRHPYYKEHYIYPTSADETHDFSID